MMRHITRIVLITWICIYSINANDFKDRAYQKIKAILGSSFQNGVDPYSEEYQDKHPALRHIELKEHIGNLWLIDNFRNGYAESDPEQTPIWTSAMIDTSKVLGAKMMINTFTVKVGFVNVKAGHAQMLFEFEDGGVELPNQKINTLVNSFEAFRGKGVKYGLVKGIQDAYDSVYVMSTYEDAIQKARTSYEDVTLFELNLSREQVKQLLINSIITAADKAGLIDTPYHTTRNSCVTNQIKLVNTVVDPEQRIKEWHKVFGLKVIRTFGSILPGSVGKTLKKFELVRDEVAYSSKEAIEEHYQELTRQQTSLSRKISIFTALYDE